ncbi:Uncharacterised protein [Mesomycoplasma conjunctivae]|uniref:P60-like lipoprotein n=1 Tax=Mesomycoplasma conjunctivae (strain ATCC 25834 / NCTC 10147 / HRC/581) TaxID=572263 RepID=C5J727_MESCH|nr:hypothetical protein [Mesomycoplasma conjunctivae]CAT05290.1 P60-like lipoprotein [Mesomycoplasma conjunctivae]VEU66519.1 Uncharacterised protein [Mesomycoplasma conjunctivae]
MKKSWKKWSLLSLATLPTIATFISCGINVQSGQREEENRKLASQETKDFIENAYVANILSQNFYSDGASVLDSFNNTNSPFYKEAKDTFDFYQKYQIAQNPTYSLNLLSQLRENNAITSVDFATLTTQAGYNKEFNEQGFQILYKNFATGIQTIINKMILVKNYLINLNESQITTSKVYKDGIGANASFSSQQIFQSIDPKSKDFFLIQLLLSKQPAQVWQFESSDPLDISTFSQLRVKDLNTFNNFLRSDNINSKSTRKEESFEKLAINDSIDSSKLLGYSGILYNQGSNGGDLDYSLSFLMSQGEIKSGFFDPQTKRILSAKNLAKHQQINAIKLYPVVLNDSFDKKNNKFQLKISDLSIKGASNTYKIVRVYPNLNSDNRSATAIVEISFNDGIKTHYSVAINWNDNAVFYNPDLPEAGKDIEQISDGVTSVNSNFDKIEVKYVNKLAPLFDKAVTSDKGETKVYFSLDNTPWKTDEQKMRLAYSLYLADQNTIFGDAKKFFEGLGYTIKTVDSSIKLDSN